MNLIYIYINITKIEINVNICKTYYKILRELTGFVVKIQNFS